MTIKLQAGDGIIFDCDSTLSTIEGIDELAALKNCRAEIAELTNQAMDGKIALEAVYSKRLEIIRPTKADLAKIAEIYCAKITAGAEEIVAKVKAQGIKIAIVSGGLRAAVLPLGEKLGFREEDIFAVDLVFDRNNNFEKVANSPLTTSAGKLEVARFWKTRENINKLVLIGDGASDLAAKGDGGADFIIGYGGVVARKQVQEKADFFTAEENLSSVLEFLEFE
ncbi:MAG: HAD-IB family phosphatase [Cardiobacteriaceae bacterium]|nr:HAD-IB family phosphatase [Cardiobacteriaceae bacterium]